jgi:hypothetical protein
MKQELNIDKQKKNHTKKQRTPRGTKTTRGRQIQEVKLIRTTAAEKPGKKYRTKSHQGLQQDGPDLHGERVRDG